MTVNKDVLESLTFICKTLGYLEVVPPYGDANYRTKQCDKAIKECEKIRAALQTPVVTDEAKREALDHIEFVCQQGNYYSVPLDSRIFKTIRAALQTPSDTALRESHDRMLEFVKYHVDDEPCSFDHHGYCQTHGYFEKGECINKQMKQAITEATKLQEGK